LAGVAGFTHFDMAKVHSRQIPYLTPRPFDDGSGWYVEAQWVDRPKERLGRFTLYSEATDWIALEAIAYFVLRELSWRPVDSVQNENRR
jgi:hypothetical protein